MKPLRKALLSLTIVLLIGPAGSAQAAPPFDPPAELVRLDQALDWSQARLIVAQDGGRYKTLESFAREHMAAMCGSESLPGLSPMASLMEWTFNTTRVGEGAGPYAHEPLVYISDRGMRVHLSAHMSLDPRNRIQRTGYMMPVELHDPIVMQRLKQIAPRTGMATAVNRVQEALVTALAINDLLRIVPRAGNGDESAAWYTPTEVAKSTALDPATNSISISPLPGLDMEDASQFLRDWASLRSAWLARDAGRVQQRLGAIASFLPSLAGPGDYPSRGQRLAEARYYAVGKFTWGWVIYFAALLIGIWALITRWKVPWITGLLFLAAGLAFHGYGLALRWYILGRIPVGNMFEAVVASSWVGVMLGLVVELVFRRRVFLVAAAATGFMALVLAQFVIPGGGTLTTLRGILDDVMLRIHTVLIVSSYALIFLAGVIAVVYLFGYYFHTSPLRSMKAGLSAVVGGLAALLATMLLFHAGPSPATPIVKQPAVAALFWTAAALAAGLLIVMIVRRRAGLNLVIASMSLATLVIIAIGSHGFVLWTGAAMVAGGFLWAAGNLAGVWMRTRAAQSSTAALLNTSTRDLAWASATPLPATQAWTVRRPLMAGGAAGDESRQRELPSWLQQFDWCHLIILNLVFVMLFAGTVLGAMWADYSWGRPWGWDPKETFALNTWIIYAILIHTRFIVARRGLWTAWLSIGGVLMMAFNWCFVNFYIVGLHSYA